MKNQSISGGGISHIVDSPTKKTNPKSDIAPALANRGNAEGQGVSSGSVDSQTNAASNPESDLFNKHYNKELRVSKDEIPIILAELNESAIAFIKKDQFEKGLNLLQKAYGITDAIDFTSCRRDKYGLFLMFHNMALCYQKMQMLEECAQCIEHSFEQLPKNIMNIDEKSISSRMRKVFIIGKLKLQYCAILSQIHRHKDALQQAREGVKVCHQMINDMYQLAQFYVKREKVNLAYKDNNSKNNDQSNHATSNRVGGLDYYSSRFDNQRNSGDGSRNMSFSNYLSQQESINGSESFASLGANNRSSLFQSKGYARKQVSSLNMRGGSNSSINQQSPALTYSLSNFCAANELENSISYLERTAKKLLPILVEVKRRMIPDKKRSKDGKSYVNSNFTAHNLHSGPKSQSANANSRKEIKKNENDGGEDSESDEDMIIDLSKIKGDKKLKGKQNQFDMKNILGYLNQGENLQTLSIGNIMQLQTFKLKDLLEDGKNELELTREAFIQKISHLAVAYFCYSTEIRFIIQTKEDQNFDVAEKQKESEYWHTKSLEIACSFLPGECPLLNHINLSYQKHFAPVKTVINEDEEEDDNLIVVKPLNGIENQKYHPIIKNMNDFDVSITPYQMTPLNAITKPVIDHLKSFNEYNESQKSQNKSNSFINNSYMNNQSQKGGFQNIKNGNYFHSASINNKQSSSTTENCNEVNNSMLLGMVDASSENDECQPDGILKPEAEKSQESDLQRLEHLFKKIQKEYNIDKVKLLKKLLDTNSNNQNEVRQKKILHGITGQNSGNVTQHSRNKLSGGAGATLQDKPSSRQCIDESQDQFSVGVDFLMDENILTNDSRDEDHQINRTPHNIKMTNMNSINQINQSGFTNQPAMKKIKTQSKTINSIKGSSQLSMHGKSKMSVNQQSPTRPHESQNYLQHQRPKTQISGQRNQSLRESSRLGMSCQGGSTMQQYKNSHNQLDQKQQMGKNTAYNMSNKFSNGHVGMGNKHGSIDNYTKMSSSQSKMMDSKGSKKSQQRPFSGGIQKVIKQESYHKSRAHQNLNQKNFSMYEQKQNHSAIGVYHTQSHQQISQTIQNGIPSGNRAERTSLNQGHRETSHSNQQIITTQSPNKYVTTSSSGAGRVDNYFQSNQGGAQAQQNGRQQQIQKQQIPNMMSQSSQQLNQKNHLQEAAGNIISYNGNQTTATSNQTLPQGSPHQPGGPGPNSLGPPPGGIGQTQASIDNQEHGQYHQYDDLKKKLMNEYKKLQKKGGVIMLNQQQMSQQQKQFQQHQKQNSAQTNKNQLSQMIEHQQVGQTSQHGGKNYSSKQMSNIVSQKQQQQIEQSLQTSAKALSQSQHAQLNSLNNGQMMNTQIDGGSQLQSTNNNLNNSTTSAHLNVYKPTFIINNSFTPGGGPTTGSQGRQTDNSIQQEHLQIMHNSGGRPSSKNQINNPQNLQITSAGPGGHKPVHHHHSQAHVMQQPSNHKFGEISKNSLITNKKQNLRGSSSSAQNGATQSRGGQAMPGQSQPNGVGVSSQHLESSKNSKDIMQNINQQQIMLMNMLMNQGMEKAQAMEQVQSQYKNLYNNMQMQNMGNQGQMGGAQNNQKVARESGKTPPGSGQGGSNNVQIHPMMHPNMIKKPMSSGSRHHQQPRGVTPTTQNRQNHTSSHPQQQILNNQVNASGIQTYMRQMNSQYEMHPSNEGRGQPSSLSNNSHQYHNQNVSSQSSFHQQLMNKLTSNGNNGGTNNNNGQSMANLPNASGMVTGGKMINSTQSMNVIGNQRGMSNNGVHQNQIQSQQKLQTNKNHHDQMTTMGSLNQGSQMHSQNQIMHANQNSFQNQMQRSKK